MSNAEVETDDRTSRPMLRRLMIYGIVLLAVFLLGLVPMWFLARGRASERDKAQRELRLCRLENSVTTAAVEARRGEYERARLATSSFFTSLHEQVDVEGESSDLTSTQKESLRPLLNQRDDLITLLARSDPAAADRLTELYMSFQKAMSGTPGT